MNCSASIPYGLLISCILADTLVDLCGYKPVKISATYNSRSFSSMGYIQVGDQWHKNSVKAKADTVRLTKVSVDAVTLLLKNMDEVKNRLLVIEENLQVFQESASKII